MGCTNLGLPRHNQGLPRHNQAKGCHNLGLPRHNQAKMRTHLKVCYERIILHCSNVPVRWR